MGLFSSIVTLCTILGDVMLFFSSADIIPSVLFSSSSAFIVIFFPDITAWVVLASLSILFTSGVTGYSAEPAVMSPCSVYFFCLTVSFSSLNIYETFPFPPYVLRKYSNTASLSSVLPEFVSSVLIPTLYILPLHC